MSFTGTLTDIPLTLYLLILVQFSRTSSEFHIKFNSTSFFVNDSCDSSPGQVAHLSHQCYEDFAKATDARRKHCKNRETTNRFKKKVNDFLTMTVLQHTHIHMRTHTQRQTHMLVCKSGMLSVCMCALCVLPGSFFMWQCRKSWC